MSKDKVKRFLVLLIVALLVAAFTQVKDSFLTSEPNESSTTSESEFTDESTLKTQFAMMTDDIKYDLSKIPEFNDKPYVELNNNKPKYTEKELKAAQESFQNFSDLDELCRCGAAVASVGTDLMPTEERGSIGMIKPTGWHTIRYDDLISDKYLYNRCHLIGYQLTGQNANEYNLITGTRYLNIDGMLPFENQIAKYVKETNNHVLYRVTPVFEGDNLVASGVIMEAMSVEDNGEGITFCVYAYNEQPGIKIDHATGESERK